MDASTGLADVSWLGVVVATTSAFVIGGVWYGPLFGGAWARRWGFTDDDLRARNMPAVFGGSIALSAVAAFVLEVFIGPEATVGLGVAAGLAAGVGWVATMLGILALFEARSLASWAIDAGYCVATLAVMGAILGAL